MWGIGQSMRTRSGGCSARGKVVSLSKCDLGEVPIFDLSKVNKTGNGVETVSPWSAMETLYSISCGAALGCGGFWGRQVVLSMAASCRVAGGVVSFTSYLLTNNFSWSVETEYARSWMLSIIFWRLT